jgi:peptidoglycan hydrolase-like protein with peptidoglycan-binding domain
MQSRRPRLSVWALGVFALVGTAIPCPAQSSDSSAPAGPIDPNKRGGVRSWQVTPMPALVVRAAQEALKRRGYDPGQIDGNFGPKTSAAVKEFQKTQGLPETGLLDRKTRDSLGI